MMNCRGGKSCRGGGGIDRGPAETRGEREREGWQVAGVGLGIPDGGDGGGRQADGVCVAGGEPQAGAQRVTGGSKPGIK